MEFQKYISIPGWDEACRQKVIAFWQERHVVFTDIQAETLHGRRGSLWGNLTSFDMSKLLATVTVSRISPHQILCILNVNTMMQLVTEWNRAYWQLEMDTLESWLLYDDKKEAEWDAFLKHARKAALRWTTTLGKAGNKLTPEMHQMLSENHGEQTLLRAAIQSVNTSQELLRPTEETGTVASNELLRAEPPQEEAVVNQKQQPGPERSTWSGRWPPTARP